MDEVKDNDLSEKIQSINNNNLQEKMSKPNPVP